MVGSVVTPLPPPVAEVVDGYLVRARAKLENPAYAYTFDAVTMQQRAARTTNELGVAEHNDATPELLHVDGVEGVRWKDTLGALLAQGYAAVGAMALLDAQKPAPAKAPATPLCLALDTFSALRRRLTCAINGNEPWSDAAKDMRARIFAGRTFTRTRASYQSEYEHVAAAMRELVNNNRVPRGVARMLPLIETALANLKALPPTTPGRHPTPQKRPPVDVLETTIALHLALGDLMSHACSTANDERLDAMDKVINVRRLKDGGETAKSEKSWEELQNTSPENQDEGDSPKAPVTRTRSSSARLLRHHSRRRPRAAAARRACVSAKNESQGPRATLMSILVSASGAMSALPPGTTTSERTRGPSSTSRRVLSQSLTDEGLRRVQRCHPRHCWSGWHA